MFFLQILFYTQHKNTDEEEIAAFISSACRTQTLLELYDIA